MKRSLLWGLILVLSSVGVGWADPVEYSKPCSGCGGKRKVSLTPPNLGQYDGEIGSGVTPGQPFKTHRWDVVLNPCPLCEGTGKHILYRTRVPAPSAEASEGLMKCPDCRWAGVVACKKCSGSGYQQCRACKSTKGGKVGWVKSEKRTAGSTSRHVKVMVTPCSTCQGLGRLVCPDCQGKGAVECRKCKGDGGIPIKERR